MDTLKSLISTMADAITCQVSEQVKKAMEATGSAQPVPEGEPSLRLEGRPSFRLMEYGRQVAQLDRSDRLPLGWQEACSGGTCCPIRTRENCSLGNGFYSLRDTLQANCLA